MTASATSSGASSAAGVMNTNPLPNMRTASNTGSSNRLDRWKPCEQRQHHDHDTADELIAGNRRAEV